MAEVIASELAKEMAKEGLREGVFWLIRQRRGLKQIDIEARFFMVISFYRLPILSTCMQEIENILSYYRSKENARYLSYKSVLLEPEVYFEELDISPEDLPEDLLGENSDDLEEISTIPVESAQIMLIPRSMTNKVKEILPRIYEFLLELKAALRKRSRLELKDIIPFLELRMPTMHGSDFYKSIIKNVDAKYVLSLIHI